MRIKLYDEIVLKDGREAVVIEMFSENSFLVDIGSNPSDWETISVTRDMIKKVLRDGD